MAKVGPQCTSDQGVRCRLIVFLFISPNWRPAPDRMTEGWLRGVADNILEEIWERTGEGPVFSERQRVYQMAYDREMDTTNYIRANYDPTDRLAIVLIDRQNKNRVTQILATREEIVEPQFQRRLRAANAQGSDVFISQSALKADATGRTKNDIEAVRHIYLDIDSGSGKKFDQIWRELPAPHHVLQSSPGKYQAIWSVSGMSIGDAERTMRGMSAQYGGDPAAIDASRVLRLPGFSNRKVEYAEQPLHFVRDVATVNAKNNEYTPSDFPTFSEAQVREYRAANTVNAGTGTKSHMDFAYAMQQLERGVSAERIRSELEARRQDKPNPAYYAQRTVDNAITKHAQNRQVKHQEGQYFGVWLG